MKTVLYYTSNSDYPALEDAVRKTIREHASGLPIISVSQQRLDFGRNVCVGPIGRSRKNIFMQLRIAAELAETEFVIVCEADFLYPVQFFQWSPLCAETYYYPEQCFILFRDPLVFYRKKMWQLTGIVARNHLLELLDELQTWPDDVKPKDGKLRLVEQMPRMTKFEQVPLGPVVTLKTDRQMYRNSQHGRGRRHERASLPGWGTPEDVWNNYPCR